MKYEFLEKAHKEKENFYIHSIHSQDSVKTRWAKGENKEKNEWQGGRQGASRETCGSPGRVRGGAWTFFTAAMKTSIHDDLRSSRSRLYIPAVSTFISSNTFHDNVCSYKTGFSHKRTKLSHVCHKETASWKHRAAGSHLVAVKYYGFRTKHSCGHSRFHSWESSNTTKGFADSQRAIRFYILFRKIFHALAPSDIFLQFGWTLTKSLNGNERPSPKQKSRNVDDSEWRNLDNGLAMYGNSQMVENRRRMKLRSYPGLPQCKSDRGHKPREGASGRLITFILITRRAVTTAELRMCIRGKPSYKPIAFQPWLPYHIFSSLLYANSDTHWLRHLYLLRKMIRIS